MRVFWPTSGIDRDRGDVVGWTTKDTVCVLGIVDSWVLEQNQVIPDPAQNENEIHQVTKVGKAYPATEGIKPGSSSNGPVYWLNGTRLPIASSTPVRVILYAPPDERRLRFLRLGNEPRGGVVEAGTRSQDSYSSFVTSAEPDSIRPVLSLLNRSRKAQVAVGQGDSTSSPASLRRYRTSEEAKADTGTDQEEAKADTGTDQEEAKADTGTDQEDLAMEAAPSRLPITLLSFGKRYSSTGDYSCIALMESLLMLDRPVDQIYLRISQALHAPGRLRRLRSNFPVEARSRVYINFWNTVWLVANDLILGSCVRQILYLIPALQTALQAWIRQYLVEWPLYILSWLNDWPVGLKLNTPLSQFFSSSLSVVISTWGSYLEHLSSEYIPLLTTVLAWSSFGGLALTLAVTTDLLSLLTLHLYLSYKLMRGICLWQLESLSGLWNLFRGKRWNVLRQRTDSYPYDIDQLFLGTLLFTVSAFLLPTVLTYTTLIAIIRCLLIVANKALGSAVSALNAFPLFELMLRLKEPSRVPGSIHFTLRRLDPCEIHCKPTADVYAITHALVLQSSPRSFVDIVHSAVQPRGTKAV
ncbi:hypothetical protein IAU60_000726 [Kwoniella sp. DSM 27419]